ncbi:MAG: NAD-dependent epimerase/dehydratase family protein [Actinomycetota bacterium]|nr:NAD-dependent epimerase/dehydratase family protein [Actinomycetota bacterium]
MARTALVTGAGGFIGANLVRRLVAEGHRVHAIVRPGARAWRLDGAPEARRVELDLGDGEAVADAVAKLRPEWIFHLAAHGAYSWQTDVPEMARVNVAGTIALVEAGARGGCEALIHAGSSSEYGYRDHAPGEEEPPQPNSPYAVTKAAATMYCAHAARQGRLAATTLRLYSAYGPWEEPGRLMPSLVTHAQRGMLPPLVGPATARDFVHVGDVVDAFLLAAQAAGRGGLAPILNLGSGTQTSLEELVAMARRIFAVPVEPRWGTAAARAWDTDVWVADVRRIKRELGWAPQRSLEAGLRGLGEWLTGEPDVFDRYLAAAPASPSTHAPPRSS